jgi:nucleolar protein 15
MVKKIAAAGAEGEKVAKVVPSQISRRFNKLRVKSGELDKKGIVYVGHLPKGFNEQELKKFFEQFGQVPKIRVSRSKKVP